MESAIRENYEHLIGETITESRVAGWDREVLQRTVEKLRGSMREEMEVLREVCYEGIFKEYSG